VGGGAGAFEHLWMHIKMEKKRGEEMEESTDVREKAI